MLKSELSSLDYFVLLKVVNDNVKQKEKKIIKVHENKMSNITTNATLPFTEKEVITNRSSIQLTKEESNILKFGLNFAVGPKFIRKTDVFVTFDLIHRALKTDLKNNADAGKLKTEISQLAHCYVSDYKPSKVTLHRHKVLSNLKKKKHIVIVKPDKGSGVVILDRQDYSKMILDILSDSSKFQKLNHDPTVKREGSLQRFLLKLKKKGQFSKEEYEKIYPSGSTTAKIYGLPKMHKLKTPGDILKLRPIISSIGTYNYELARYLTDKLTPYIPNKHTVKDTFTFVNDISKLDVKGKHAVSFDVTSLFTNIPLVETIEIAADLICQNDKTLKINKNELKKLFLFATAQTHFSFEDMMYDQVDGVAMGSPLGPVLANIFMGHHEDNWLNNYQQSKPVYYKRYVDDIFCLFNEFEDSQHFLNFINSQHPNIKFTVELAINGILPFLDVSVDISKGDKPQTTVFRKETFTGLLTNFLSYTPLAYKIALVKTLIHRAYSICNLKTNFDLELKKIKKILSRNRFLPSIVDREVKKYLSKKNSNKTLEKDTNEHKLFYYKLPYIRDLSEKTKSRLKTIAETFCKGTKIQLSFSPLKIGSFFSTKDKVPDDQKSFVVYMYVCPNCGIRYIGETTKHLPTRIDEHQSTASSNIYQHLIKNNECKSKYSKECFKIIDSAKTKFSLKLKEAMHIKWKSPELNKQLTHVSLSIIV